MEVCGVGCSIAPPTTSPAWVFLSVLFIAANILYTFGIAVCAFTIVMVLRGHRISATESDWARGLGAGALLALTSALAYEVLFGLDSHLLGVEGSVQAGFLLAVVVTVAAVAGACWSMLRAKS